MIQDNTGSTYDKSTNLYYLNARYYNPQNGRFLTRDSYRGEIDQPETLHLYAYCANNPISRKDPSGHFTITITTRPAPKPYTPAPQPYRPAPRPYTSTPKPNISTKPSYKTIPKPKTKLGYMRIFSQGVINVEYQNLKNTLLVKRIESIKTNWYNINLITDTNIIHVYDEIIKTKEEALECV